MMLLRLQMLAPVSAKCNWKRRMSSSVAVSGERLRNAANRLQLLMWSGETSVLFELISARYERRSMLITANQPFGERNKVFPDPAMTLAAIDRLVHHATIVEMNVVSYRRRTALERKRGPGRPPSHATPKTVAD
jgi:hypothetical protein